MEEKLRKLGTAGLLKKPSNKCSKRESLSAFAYPFLNSSSLTITDQLVEKRRQLVGVKAPRRSTEASPQDAFRQRQRVSDRGAREELIRELEIRALRRSLP